VTHSPGAPGIEPRWTSSAKNGIGTALGSASRIWFTISHGILNEIYAPRLDSACTRDFGLIVTADGYFSEEKRDAYSQLEMMEEGVPAFRLVNTAKDGRYRITKTIFSDPLREVVLQDIRFEALVGELSDYAVHAIIAPHLVNAGADNTAWTGDFKGHKMLFAEGRGTSLAVASSVPWLARSAGYVGVSDGWQSLFRGEGLRPEFDRAENGNVALSGTLNLSASDGRALLAIGFGVLPEEAALRTLLSMQSPISTMLESYCADWRVWQKTLLPLDAPRDPARLNLYRVSTAVLASHRDDESGAIIASLSIPWGFSKGDNDLGGYHLVWPRDLVETAGGLLAAGSETGARSVLDYLRATQEADGHWSQNSWLDGRPYWSGIQIDETGFPILLYDMLLRAGAICPAHTDRYGRMIEAAASYIIRNGPVTQEDRWEEDSGYSPFTIAVEIAALLAAADALDAAGKHATAEYVRETADYWNEEIESWTYASDTEMSRKLGISGYYMRIGYSEGDAVSRSRGFIPIRNRADADASVEAGLLISPDALALVRFGLRGANDPRILDTIVAIDSLLKRDLPAGPYWYRYNNDGYGEHVNGAPFDGKGVGRLWPLLTGERAHYELAAGKPAEARRLLATMEASACLGGLLPEQIWDNDDIPERELHLGRPSGSAMPLVWAHAEHIKLLRSLRDGAVFDMPPQPFDRYVKNAWPVAPVVWRMTSESLKIAVGRKLRLEFLEPAMVHVPDNWASTENSNAVATGLGTYICDLPTENLTEGRIIVFTIYWPKQNKWAGIEYRVSVGDG
jgi:glucoamylase